MDAERRANELAEDLHRVLSRVVLVLARRGPSGIAVGDLTLAQLSILMVLCEQGPMQIAELAAHERVRTATTTVAVGRLEKFGLVKRSRDLEDMRAALVEITPHGHSICLKSLALRHAELSAMLNKLSAHEQETLSAAMPALERLAHRANLALSPPPRCSSAPEPRHSRSPKSLEKVGDASS